jgi:hypothetical protein
LRSVVAIYSDEKVLTQVQTGFDQVPGQIQDLDTDEKGIISEVSEGSRYGSGVNHFSLSFVMGERSALSVVGSLDACPQGQ